MDYAGITSLLPKELEKQYVYRIISFDHLVEWFETKVFVLLSPRKWEDPFEKYLMEKIFPDKDQLSYQKGRMYGLCFSRDGISDALWRIYSHNQFGVRIKTTPDLLASAISTASSLVAGKTFIGEVNYYGTEKLITKARSLKNRIVDKLETQDVAKIMLLKRTHFRHEKEIRFLHLTYDKGPQTDILHFDIDPHTVIKSILIDPRAPERRAQALKRHFQELCGYKGTIKQSVTYKVPNF